MLHNLQEAVKNDATPEATATAAARDAATAVSSDEVREDLARKLYKEVTGGFPQKSSDRRAVFTGAFVLLGVLVVAFLATVSFLALNKAEFPEWLATFMTAIGTGILGGVFGYAKQ